MFAGPHGENRTRGQANDLFRHGTQQQLCNRAAAMCANDHEVDILFFGGIDDFEVRRADPNHHAGIRKARLGELLLGMNPGLLLLDFGEIRREVPFSDGWQLGEKIRPLEHMANEDIGPEGFGER